MINLKMPTYDILICEHGLDQLQGEIEKVYTSSDVYIVTDQHVYDFYHEVIIKHLNKYQLHFSIIKPGEASKCFETYQTVIHDFIHQGMKRNHLMIALGGGVVGDLAGFVAATIFRGVKFVQIPTTLLAMVDSSIGGKVGIDIEEGKNLVGAFYNPSFVYITPIFLETLPKREYVNGLAEMFKAGLIADKNLYHYLLTHDEVSIKEIQMAIQVKRDVVLVDPYDHKERMYLNFGHTFGHAIEAKHNYQTYKHGEAVSYGMLIALKLGYQWGLNSVELYEEVRDRLLQIGLVKEPLLEAKDYIDYIGKDKKFIDQTLNYIYVHKPGQAMIKHVTIKDFI